MKDYEQTFEIVPATAAAGYQAARQALEAFMDKNKGLIERLDVQLEGEMKARQQEREAETRTIKADIEALKKERERLESEGRRCWFDSSGHRDLVFQLDMKISHLHRKSLYAVTDRAYDLRYSARLTKLSNDLRERHALGLLSATNLRLTKSEVANLQRMIDGTWIDENWLVMEIREKAAEVQA